MRQWSDSIDPASIPDAVLTSEWARRNAAKRRTYGAGSGRPKIMRPCPTCGVEFSASDLRRHRCKTTSDPALSSDSSDTLKSE
jgi:hypothetical protein